MKQPICQQNPFENSVNNKDEVQIINMMQQQNIQNFLCDLQQKNLLKYADDLQDSKILQIALAFNQISIRTCLQPQLIHTIKPTKQFIRNLILLFRIVERKQLIFQVNQQDKRGTYLNQLLMFLNFIFNGANDLINQKLKQKVIKNKNFLKILFKIQLHTLSQDCCSIYTILIYFLTKSQLSLIQKKQLALSIIKNLKYLIHYHFSWCPISILKDLFEENKNIMTWKSIQQHNLIKQLQIVFEQNKTDQLCVYSIDLLMGLVMKFKSGKNLLDFSDPFKRFFIPDKMKQFIINNRSFKRNYIFYFAYFCQTYQTQHLETFSRYFINQLRQLVCQEKKLQQRDMQVWVQFLLDIMEIMIMIGQKQQSVRLLEKNGMFEWGMKVIKLKMIDQILENKIIKLLMEILNYLEKNQPYQFSYYTWHLLTYLRNSFNKEIIQREDIKMYVQGMKVRLQSQLIQKLQLQ